MSLLVARFSVIVIPLEQLWCFDLLLIHACIHVLQLPHHSLAFIALRLQLVVVVSGSRVDNLVVGDGYVASCLFEV